MNDPDIHAKYPRRQAKRRGPAHVAHHLPHHQQECDPDRQHLFEQTDAQRDASGNLLHQDIGVLLRQKIREYFAQRGYPVELKYFDPSYLIRSIPANVYDRYLADQMARHGVHAAMAGKTDLVIGKVGNRGVHVPISAVVSQTKAIDVSSDMWQAVLQTTGQPRW